MVFQDNSKNEAYDFEQSKFEMKINDTMEKIYYEYNFKYGDVLIENIVLVE